VPLIGDRPFVPDHKVYFADFLSAEAAHFVCGILNSTLVKEYVESHTIQIQVSNIFKHLSIPKFDPSSSAHKQLAATSKRAHASTSKKARQDALADLNIIAERILNP
jgi:hypothetical protein